MENQINKSSEMRYPFWFSGMQKIYFAIMLFMGISVIVFLWCYKPGNREDNLFFRISFIILISVQGLMLAIPTLRSLIDPQLIFDEKGIQAFQYRLLKRTKKIIIPSKTKLHTIINERLNIFQISIEGDILYGFHTIRINKFKKEDRVVLRKIFEGIAESKIYDFQQVLQLIANAKIEEEKNNHDGKSL